MDLDGVQQVPFAIGLNDEETPGQPGIVELDTRLVVACVLEVLLDGWSGG